ncbi:MAG: polysaccharide biosynthesis C-terminal domain-containing protein, partial [Planococcus sp. (in: Bacteria)]|nr:polysaccharide biosynthesis C-terminal domain-containing protein [Planococcus sp. (in: firmicutes)]
FPVMVGMAAIGEPLVLLVFGEKWLLMVPYFQLLSIAGMLYPILALDLSILQVKGRSDLYLYLEIINKLSLTILLFLAVWLELGVIGLIGAAILNTYLEFFVNSHVSKREVAYPATEKLGDLLPIYLISFGMGAVVWLIGQQVEGNLLFQMVLQVTAGIFIYIAVCRIANIGELRTVYGLISSVLAQKNKR